MPPVHSVLRAPSLALVLLLAGGCATYRPAPDVASVPEGREIRMRLSDAGSDRVGEYTATGDRHDVEGSLVRADADSVVVALWRSDVASGSARFEPGRVEVPLERDQVLLVEEKQLSTVRTVGLVAGLAAGVYLIFDQLFGGSTAGGIEGGGGPDITLLPRTAAGVLAGWLGSGR